MEAMALVDDRRVIRDVDALLRTHIAAHPAANTVFAHIIARRFSIRFSNSEAVPVDMRRITDVKILALCFVQAEYFQSAAGVSGINGLHIWIFSKISVSFSLSMFRIFPRREMESLSFVADRAI